MTSNLKDKSIIELRSIASGLGIEIEFSDSKAILMQKIDRGLDKQLPEPPAPEPNVPSNIRLRTTPPSKNVTPDEINDILAPFVTRGLRLTFPAENQWHMQLGKKSDSGTLRMPLRIVLDCAQRLFK